MFLSNYKCFPSKQFRQTKPTKTKRKKNFWKPKIKIKKQQLRAQEDRLVKLESCDCRKSCKTYTGETKKDGDIWESSCKTCACEKGVVTCEAKKCNETLCKYPEIDHNIDACCPVCLSEYFC